MAWIKTTSPEEATGRLKEIYDSLLQKFPLVPNIMQSFSLKPEVLAAVARVFTTGTFGGSNLSRVQEEMIATVVSSLNRCHYWTNSHAEVLRVHSNGANDLVATLKRDWRAATLSAGDRAMLAYAEKLTLTPSQMTSADLDGLRQYFSEVQAYDIVLIASLFNFIDRIADAFGVELDAFTRHMAHAAPDGEALKELAASERSRG